MGRRWADCADQIEAALGRPLPEGFVANRRALNRKRVEAELEAVVGVHDFLARHAAIPSCIASSSTFEWLEFCLARFGLEGDFAGRLFSGTEVEHGKPAPDLFLLAARTLGHAPADTWVIEDSPAGVQAGVAAGMTVVGFTGGSHAGDGHADLLRAAGAHHVAADFDAVAALLAGGRAAGADVTPSAGATVRP